MVINRIGRFIFILCPMNALKKLLLRYIAQLAACTLGQVNNAIPPKKYLERGRCKTIFEEDRWLGCINYDLTCSLQKSRMSEMVSHCLIGWTVIKSTEV